MDGNDESLAKHLWILFAIAIVAAAAVALFYFIFLGSTISSDHTKWAEFGDFFGGILNPIFGFIGLIALLLTITLQARELKLTRNELSNSSTALASQNDTLLKNNFENSFFQMLRLHNEIVESIDLVRGGGRINMNSPASPIVTTKGRDCLRVFLSRLSENYDEEKHSGDGKTEIDVISSAYEEFYVKHGDEIGHYYRYLYNIFKFIHNSDIDDKPFYSNLVRAQLSNSELVLLHYNSMSRHGSKKFLPLIKEYKVLKSLPVSKLFDKSHASLGYFI